MQSACCLLLVPASCNAISCLHLSPFAAESDPHSTRWLSIKIALPQSSLTGSEVMLCLGAVTVCQAPANGFLEDQLERGWWAGSDAGISHSSTHTQAVLTYADMPKCYPGGTSSLCLHSFFSI